MRKSPSSILLDRIRTELRIPLTGNARIVRIRASRDERNAGAMSWFIHDRECSDGSVAMGHVGGYETVTALVTAKGLEAMRSYCRVAIEKRSLEKAKK